MLEQITEQQLAENGVVSAPDKLEGDPKDNKAIFDRLITQLVAGVVNQIIEAHNALDENVNGRINAVLDELRNHVDVDPGNITAQNVGLLRELADKYGLTDKLAPTVHDALEVLHDKGVAQAAAVDAAFDDVGVRLDGLDAQHTIEKIADVTITQDTSSFYIELPQTLSHYPFIFVKAIECQTKSGGGSSPGYCYPVESLQSTETAGYLFSFANGQYKYYRQASFSVIAVTAKTETEVRVYGLFSGELDYDDVTRNVADCRNTKYLYVTGEGGFGPGGHIELWGVAK